MRLFAIIVLLIFVSVSQRNSRASENQNANQETQTERTKPEQRANTRDSPGRLPIQEPKTQYKQDASYDPRTDLLYRSYLWATILGVVGALLGIGLIYKQTTIAKDAAMAAKKSADAALLNAQAVITSERAWIDADMAESGNQGRHIIRATNHGRTVARIAEFEFSYASYAGEVKQLPASVLRHSDERIFVERIIGGGVKRIPVYEFDVSHYMSDDDREGKTTAVFTAKIEYRDIFNDQTLHSTEIVYSFKRSTGTLAYLPNYTKYT